MSLKRHCDQCDRAFTPASDSFEAYRVNDLDACSAGCAVLILRRICQRNAGNRWSPYWNEILDGAQWNEPVRVST